jgi:hypothetical protein
MSDIIIVSRVEELEGNNVRRTHRTIGLMIFLLKEIISMPVVTTTMNSLQLFSSSGSDLYNHHAEDKNFWHTILYTKTLSLCTKNRLKIIFNAFASLLRVEKCKISLYPKEKKSANSMVSEQ